MYRLRLLVLAVLMTCVAANAQYIRPGKEVRTINTDVYEISVQKNGRTDINFTTREPVFENAFPMVQLDGDSPPRVLQVDGRFSSRTEVNDPLGKGHGLLLVRDDCEWHLRAYPTKPFFTVALTFTNTTKKPVHVRKLMPWCVGEARKGAAHLGPRAEEVRFLHEGSGVDGGPDMLAAVADASRRSLIAGFLTHTRAATQVGMSRSSDAAIDAFDSFQASCTYDPPVTLQPGEKLEAELLYVSVGETDPLLGLERFAKAMAVTNGVRDQRPFKPHGPVSGGTETEDAILREVAFISQYLKPYGWNHFTIGAGWETAAGDWRTDPAKFPNGIQATVQAIHDAGMTAGIRIDPCTVDLDSDLARNHPDWMLPPNAASSALLGPQRLLLDITRPEVQDHVSSLTRKVREEWGFDALMIDDTSALFHGEGYFRTDITRAEILHLGMQAIRSAFGEDGFVRAPHPDTITGLYADAILPEGVNAPMWDSASLTGPQGVSERLTQAIRRFYMAPHLYLLSSGGGDFDSQSVPLETQTAMTEAQRLAWWTGAALLGGPLEFNGRVTELDAGQLAVLKKLLPLADKPARPIDLFSTDRPQIWSLPLETEAGAWHILGLFNWQDDQAKTLSISWTDLGLPAEKYFTVYDFWGERFYGLSQQSLEIEVPAGSVRVIGLRVFDDRPMFLAHDRHFAQGALEYKELTWNDQQLTLNGVFDAIADTRYTVRLYVPENFTVTGLNLEGQTIPWTMEGPVMRFTLDAQNAGSLAWEASFSRLTANAR